MIEELALAILFGIIGQSSGIIADRGVRKLIRYAKDASENKKFINHDLKKGLTHAYILALMNLVNECLERSKESEDVLQDEIQWLETKKRQLSSDLRLNEKKGEWVEFDLSLIELESLLSSPQIPNSQYIIDIKNKLNAYTLRGNVISPCFKEKVINSFFDELALYFAFEIKNNDRLRHIFENEVLSQIDLRIDDLEKSIDNSALKYPELQNKLDAVHTELIVGRIQLDAHYAEINQVLTGSVGDLSEIKTHLKILTRQLEYNNAEFTIDESSIAILYINKDDIDIRKKIPLKNDKKIFIIGRKIKDFIPDIPLCSPFISKQHAIIENTNNGFMLTDKGSKNGTRLNGILLEKGRAQRLNHGDQISLAKDKVICYFCLRNDSLETLELP